MGTAFFRTVALAAAAALPAAAGAQSWPSLQELAGQVTLRASGALPTSMQKLLGELGATRKATVPVRSVYSVISPCTNCSLTMA